MKKNQKWQMLALVLFIGLGLWMASVAAAAEKASASRWEINSDRFVSVSISDTKQIPTMPLLMAAHALASELPQVGILFGEADIRVHFESKNGVLTTKDIEEARNVLVNVGVLLRDLGITSESSGQFQIFHKSGQATQFVRGGGGLRVIVDLLSYKPGTFSVEKTSR